MFATLASCVSLAAAEELSNNADVFDRVTHGYAESSDVRIHYATIGEGPLVVMIHGYPDFWYSWRHQMAALSDRFQVVAVDLRGYNLSDKPAGVENYSSPLLVGDIEAVIRHFGKEKAIVVGHDWGGFIAWMFAMSRPEMTERLVICNLPHPRGFARELAHNAEQQKNSQYARNFQQPGAAAKLTAEELVAVVAANESDAVKARYLDAFKQSDFEAMLAYYKMNYPREPYREDTGPVVKVAMPVLMFHGLDDWALNHAMLNRTWEWLEQDLTLVTVPGAGHWVHHDSAELVSKTMRFWLTRDDE
jgi:pimeloyl-ACP methyl ester carboxylesterase